jgi:hypothetical protein
MKLLIRLSGLTAFSRSLLPCTCRRWYIQHGLHHTLYRPIRCSRSDRYVRRTGGTSSTQRTKPRNLETREHSRRDDEGRLESEATLPRDINDFTRPPLKPALKTRHICGFSFLPDVCIFSYLNNIIRKRRLVQAYYKPKEPTALKIDVHSVIHLVQPL